jgi:subtilisin family serine protease
MNRTGIRTLAVLLCLASTLASCPDGARPAAATAGAPAGESYDASLPVKMSPLDREFLTQQITQAEQPVTPPPASALLTRTLFLVAEVEFENQAARERYQPPAGISIFNRFERFADLFVEPGKPELITSLQKADGVRWVEAGQVLAIPPPPKTTISPERARGAVPIISGGFEGLSGKGVVIAVVDSGVDFRHSDFIRTGEDNKPTSRLLYFWDTLTPPGGAGKPGSKGPLSYPNGAPIGTLYSREELTAELREPRGGIAVTDTNGHGTACAGIAAGNGSSLESRKYAGVAPDADLIAVRVGSGLTMENAYLLNAICSWLDQVVGDRPLVISCSFGGSNGGHDGFQVSERQLAERFPANRRGRALCIAAGNDGLAPTHALVNFAGTSSRGTLSCAAPVGGQLSVYIDQAERDDIGVELFGYPAVKVVSYTHPLSGSLVLQVPLGGGVLGGQMDLYSKSGKSLQASAYLPALPATGFIGRGANGTCLVETPGTCAGAITVGSYDFNDVFVRPTGPVPLTFSGKALQIGHLSAYSSPGYTRQGKAVKPDITAPGQYFTAPASKSTPADALDASGRYRYFNGTSAATPYTAGVVALLLEKKHDLTAGELKELLRTEATTDGTTGPTPNTGWGYGKLDNDAVRQIIGKLEK